MVLVAVAFAVLTLIGVWFRGEGHGAGVAGGSDEGGGRSAMTTKKGDERLPRNGGRGRAEPAARAELAVVGAGPGRGR